MEKAESLALSIKGVKREMGGEVSEGLVRLLISRGELPAHRFGRRVVILRTDLLAYLNRNKVQPARPAE